MIIKIIDMIPADNGKVQMYYTIDSGELTALLLEKTDLNNIQTIKNAVEELLKGKEYIGQSFEI